MAAAINFWTAAIVVLVAASTHLVSALPDGFFREYKLADTDITKLRFLPDGRAMISYRQGDLVLANPSETPMKTQRVLTLTNLRMDGEKGLLSFVLDPDFANNGKLSG